MNEVRTFTASSMQEALELVRSEMGSDAVILHTREIRLRRKLPWRRPKEQVEVTAGVGVNVRPARVRKSEVRIPAAPLPFEEETSRVDEPIFEAVSAASVEARLARTTALDVTSQFANKLDAIQKMLEQLKQPIDYGSKPDIPTELFDLYTELLDAEVEDDLAREFLFRLQSHSAPLQLADTQAAKHALTAMVESEIRCCGPIRPTPGKRKVVALVGSTGVGKTTTVAKLAANFKLRDGIKMGLITVDTYRIAAVEQLRTYAEIIDLPMKVVTSPPEMRRAIDELSGLDLVLIDTAGRSPQDELRIQELKSLLAEANVDEVHLVLNLTGSLRSVESAAEKFKAAGVTAMILTKLDEASGMGAILSMTRKIPLPISYITTGQDVPDDIEPAVSPRISRLILGQERIGG